ncbi:uncharacterized protein LOC122850045 [Aphidius gifuensis]|uniref:uncharacterized protein LOC122850045 n=1 Tax=Aphidius gifuensis TaxID=684658 RepID=UPI001CDBDD7C|nr:uncharacterized protein LOC122850045 [Aphidius gifuensis]
MFYKVFFVVLIAVIFVESKPTLFDKDGNRTPLGQTVENAEKSASGFFHRAIERVQKAGSAVGESFKEVVNEDIKATQNAIDATRAAGKQVAEAVKDKIAAARAIVETIPRAVIKAADRLASTEKP